MTTEHYHYVCVHVCVYGNLVAYMTTEHYHYVCVHVCVWETCSLHDNNSVLYQYMVFTTCTSEEIRLCVDFRRLNSITVREPYYMPSMTEIMEKVGQSCVLSKLDLSKGFYQVSVCPEDRCKTAFICPFGKFEFLRMPFELCNAPSVFQRLMEYSSSSLKSRKYRSQNLD